MSYHFFLFFFFFFFPIFFFLRKCTKNKYVNNLCVMLVCLFLCDFVRNMNMDRDVNMGFKYVP